ncbi:MAG: hypothetical protein U0324_38945 [Polyangiales bacterium]
MRRNPFDLFAKDCLELLLEDAGRVERSLEVAAPAQLIDAAFTPSPRGLAKLRRRGLLGRLARQRCAWECFHDAPSLDDLRALVRKHLGWHALLTARARRGDRDAVVPLRRSTSSARRAPPRRWRPPRRSRYGRTARASTRSPSGWWASASSS